MLAIPRQATSAQQQRHSATRADRGVPVPAAATQPAAGRSARSRGPHAPARSRSRHCPRSPACRSGTDSGRWIRPDRVSNRRSAARSSGSRIPRKPRNSRPATRQDDQTTSSATCSQPGSSGGTSSSARQRKTPTTAERRPQGGPDRLEQDRRAGQEAGGRQGGAAAAPDRSCGKPLLLPQRFDRLAVADNRPASAVHPDLGRQRARVVG